MNHQLIYYNVTQGSPEWHACRSGLLTPSKLSIVMCGSVKAKNTLLKELAFGAAPKKNITCAAMEWGKTHEKNALATYEIETGIPMIQVGFYKINNLLFGGSPDAILNPQKDNSIRHGVEIKCPYRQENHQKHLNGSISDNYLWQVFGYMYLLDANFWDFVSYDPRETEINKKICIREFVRDDGRNKQIHLKVQEFTELLLSCKFYEEQATAKELLMSGVVPKFFN